MAAKVNLTIDQGADFIYHSFLVDAAGAPIDLTGYTGKCQLRTSYTSPNYANVDITLNSPMGSVVLTMNSTSTSNLTSARYVYDVEVTSSDSVTSRVMEGTVTVNPNVTR